MSSEGNGQQLLVHVLGVLRLSVLNGRRQARGLMWWNLAAGVLYIPIALSYAIERRWGFAAWWTVLVVSFLAFGLMWRRRARWWERELEKLEKPG